MAEQARGRESTLIAEPEVVEDGDGDPDFPRFGGPTWDRMGQWATVSVGLRALTLQTAHPMVGAAVHEHSTFASRPFARLIRALVSAQRLVFDSPGAAAAEGRRL